MFDFEEDDTKPDLFYSVYKHCLPVRKKKQNIEDDAQASEVKIVQITFSSVLMEFWLKTPMNFIIRHLHLDCLKQPTLRMAINK